AQHPESRQGRRDDVSGARRIGRPSPHAGRAGVHEMNLQSLLGVELPIIQAPMAGVQGGALAVAVSEAGGLGSLPCAMLGPEAMRKELAAIRSQTDRPFNVNFFCHAQPEPDAGREAAWRKVLAPYLVEYGIDVSAIAPGP